jgi:hypothetical protein
VRDQDAERALEKRPGRFAGLDRRLGGFAEHRVDEPVAGQDRGEDPRAEAPTPALRVGGQVRHPAGVELDLLAGAEVRERDRHRGAARRPPAERPARSPLFGHARGAFTGAVGRKLGLLAAAAGGTLFLDEVGELPLEAQTMLLRFLQQGEVRALGSTHTTRVDVRLISATHRSLKAAVEQGLFEHFRRAINRRWKLAVEGITPEAMARLEAHP